MFVTVTLNPAIDITLTIQGRLTAGAVHTVASETRTPGGKGINVAKMIAANGRPVCAGGIVGTEDVSFFESELHGAGIRTLFLPVPFPTRRNLMVSGANTEMKFNRPGFPDLEYDRAALGRYVLDLASRGTVVVISGSLPTRFRADACARLIPLLKEEGKSVVVDASGAALRAAADAGPHILKPNREELQELAGRSLAADRDVEAAVRALLQKHEVVIVSDGARGAWFGAGALLLHAVPPEVRAVDTTGAGDSMLGQFCADYFPARTLTPEIAARAVAAGAAAVEQHGTPSISVDRMRELAGRARVRAVTH